MTTPSATIHTLTDFAVNPWAWTKAEDGSTYLYALWGAKGTPPPEVIHSITAEELAAVDERLPILVSEAFSRHKSPSEKGKCINQSIRFWLNEHPLNMFTIVYKTWYLDRVVEVQSCNRDSQRIRLATSSVEMEMVKDIPVVKKSHSLTETRAFAEIEAAFPFFLTRMDIAQSMDMERVSSMAYIFPMSPDVNKLFYEHVTPELPEFD